MTEQVPRSRGRPRREIRLASQSDVRLGACVAVVLETLGRVTSRGWLLQWLTQCVTGDSRVSALLVRHPEGIRPRRAEMLLDQLRSGQHLLDPACGPPLDDLEAAVHWPGSDAATFGARCWAGLRQYADALASLRRLLDFSVDGFVGGDRPFTEWAPGELRIFAAVTSEKLQVYPQRTSVWLVQDLVELVHDTLGTFLSWDDTELAPEDIELAEDAEVIDDAAARALGKLRPVAEPQRHGPEPRAHSISPGALLSLDYPATADEAAQVAWEHTYSTDDDTEADDGRRLLEAAEANWTPIERAIMSAQRDDPTGTWAAIAERVASHMGIPMTAEMARQTYHRAAVIRKRALSS